ncbi:MAG: pirin family protein, partial [Actinobacteria bacterium]|nr:pirin family protein [Actinomycetota bacterium]
MSDDVILQTVPLGLHWPTIDPFLFCAHHDDQYPSGNEQLGPDASLEGRNIGMDFEGIDGWRMYHGSVVPGFPQHPHRGFETITYVREGICDHSDSLGAIARFGEGDVQWLTAGAGIVHSEMMPLRNQSAPNPLELFQIWLNLPAADKMSNPYFTMLWSNQIPKVRHTNADGRTTEVVIIAGSFGETPPLSPPPNSWASKGAADVAVW